MGGREGPGPRTLDAGTLHLKRSTQLPFGIDDLPPQLTVYRAVPRVDANAVKRGAFR